MNTKTIQLTSEEIEFLATELTAFSKELVTLKVKFNTYKLLNIQLKPILEIITSVKNELISKYGTTNTETNQIEVKVYTDAEKTKFTDEYLKFVNELNHLYNTTHNISYDPIMIDEIADIKTTSEYFILYKLVEFNENTNNSANEIKSYE